MKKCIMNTAFFISLIPYCCFLFFILTLNNGCRKAPLIEDMPRDVTLNTEIPTTDATPLDQLIVWVKPGVSRQKFFQWRDSIVNLPDGKGGAVNISRACSDCDSSLMLLTGTGIKTYIKGHTVSGGVGTSGTDSDVSGDTSAVYHSLNYKVNWHPSTTGSLPNNSNNPTISLYTAQSVKVGVLDTGVDTFEVNNYPFKSDSPSCIKAIGADVGWNFVNFTRNTADDEAYQHGSTVTRFITDYFDKNMPTKVQILPVKTHDANGEGDLFRVLCAFAYAKQRGVKIINASFGFYLPRLDTSVAKIKYTVDPNIILLKKYTHYYLTRNSILLIAAAGNKDTENKKLAFIENDTPYVPTNPQILNQVPFYPGVLANDPAFPNVITVTTVYVDANGLGTMSDQNYSNDVVDIGVIADTVINNNYYERNPKKLREGILGSSFATPIVTGRIAGNYNLISGMLSKQNYTRTDLLNALSPIFLFNTNLKSKIRDGRVMKK